MKNIRMVVLAFVVLLTLNCSKEDVNSQAFNYSLIDTDSGARFTLIYPDGKEEKIRGTTVFGSFNEQLLDGDYSKSFHGAADDIRFQFRFAIPKDIAAADVIEGTHQLRSQRLRLEQTGNLGILETEFWLGTTATDDEFDGLVNVIGSVNYEQNITTDERTLDIVVEIEGSVMNRAGQKVIIEGLFWKAKDDNL